MSDPDLDELRRQLPRAILVTDRDLVEKYRRDATDDDHAGRPIGVVWAETSEHVSLAVKWCARNGVPIVPRGAGSGLAGGATAVDGGLIILLERMTEILIDTTTQMAVVGAGAVNADVKDAALVPRGSGIPRTPPRSAPPRSAATSPRTLAVSAASVTE